MNPLEIKKGIHWVGAIDWDLRNFHGYLTQRGSTYNAYLIVDEKITLVDTVKHYMFDEMLERIKKVVDPAKIDIIVSNHVEMDHSGCLTKMLEICPKAVVVTSTNGEKGLKKHYDTSKWNLKAVNSGDTLNIGKRSLTFVHVAMVHWPDSMVTYIPEEKLLLPNDAFGQHVASNERFDDELGWDTAREEAAKYYANIVLPFGAQVTKALEAAATLDIDMIAPSHGVIWRKHIKDILPLYKKWAANETDDKAVVVFDTMWNSTKMIACAVREALEDKGIPAVPCDLKTTHISDVMTEVLSAKYIFVGSPTLNNGMLPTVAAFLTYMKGLAPKKRIGLAYGSYGWGGQSVGQIDDILKACGFQTIESIKVQYIPSGTDLKAITEKIKAAV